MISVPPSTAGVPSHSKQAWVSGASGRSGLGFNYVAWQEDASAVGLYIDTGDASENKRIFDQLLARRKEIEATFGEALAWERLDAKRACRIRHEIQLGGLRDSEQWPAIQEAMVKAMDRLVRALKPEVRRLKE